MATTENNIQQFIQKLAQRERVSPQKIREIIISSFRNSYCQGENKEVDLHFNFETDLEVYRKYKLVDKVINPEKEIALGSELLKEGKTQGDSFFLPLDIKKLSFSFNYEVKKAWERELGSVQQEKQLESFKSLPGEIIQGTIQ